MAIENEDQVSVLEGGDGRGAAPKTPEVSALLRPPTTASDIAQRIGAGKTVEERARLGRQEMPSIMAEQSKAELEAARTQEAVSRKGLEQAARAEKEVLSRAKGAVEEVDKETKAYQEFVQPEYKASDYAANAAARLFTGLMLGGVAKISAIGQLQAIRDMQKAEDQGLREKFTAARIKFEEAEKSRKDFNNNIKDRFDRLMKLLPYDRNAALAEAKIIEAGLKDGAIVAAMKAGDYGKANKFVQKYIDQGNQVDIARIAAQVKAETRQPAAGQVFFGTGDKGNQVPILIDPRTAKAKVVELPPGVTGITKPGAEGKVGQNALTFASRVYGNIENAAQDLRNITQLPSTAEQPVFAGLLNVDRNTALGSIQSLAARKITNKEARAFQQVTDQLGFALSRLEAQGLASGATKAAVDAFNSLRPAAGDRAINMAIYLARVKQEIQTGIKVHEKMPGATKEQISAAKGIVGELDRIVPFTVTDVLDTLRKGKQPLVDKTQKLINLPSVSQAIEPQAMAVTDQSSETAPTSQERPEIIMKDGVRYKLNPITGGYKPE